jgi:hypothetical protein
LDSTAEAWSDQAPKHDADHGEAIEGDDDPRVTVRSSAQTALRLIQANVRSKSDRFNCTANLCRSHQQLRLQFDADNG